MVYFNFMLATTAATAIGCQQNAAHKLAAVPNRVCGGDGTLCAAVSWQLFCHLFRKHLAIQSCCCMPPIQIHFIDHTPGKTITLWGRGGGEVFDF